MARILIVLSALFAVAACQSPAFQLPDELRELLVSRGIKDGQVALILLTPNNVASNQPNFARYLQVAAQPEPLTVRSPAQKIDVHYQSQSAPLNVQHTHIPAPTPETKLSRSEEQPHRVVHEIIRPVIQEVREIIQPYRRIVQEIRPVQESIVTQVSGQNNRSQQSTPVSTN